MSPGTSLIAQTLHGYDQGHRLLACGGDVDETELAQLDRLSDLSGYVPVGTEFDHYYTGFLCGRYYAFACTWPDRKATRAGTVLTHTLLIPRDKLDAVHDLWRLAGHRRPGSALDREPYKEPLSFDIECLTHSPPMPSEERAASAIVLWFGQSDRPVLWTEQGGAEDVVRYVWSLLWQEARESFSFCTFALQVRYLRRQPFGFLVLPPSARGSFHDRARSAAWWQDDQLFNAQLRERTTQPWVRRILEKRAEATFSIPRFCRDNVLTLLDELAYPVFHRFAELEEPAKIRLTAARARMDLLQRLWSDVNPLHPLVAKTLYQVLQQQGDAPLAPRPFWDLIDFLKRPAVRPLMETDTDFAAQVIETVAREVERRLIEAENIDGIGQLLALAMHTEVRAGIIGAVARVFERYRDEASRIAKGSTLLLASVDVSAPELVDAIFNVLKPEQRRSMSLKALQEIPEQSRAHLADHILTAAHRLDDVTVVADVWFALNQPARALADVTSMVLSSATPMLDRLALILERFSAEERFSWALQVEDARLAKWAGKKGGEAGTELGLSLPVVIERGQEKTNFGCVVLSFLEEVGESKWSDEELLVPAVATAIASTCDETAVVARLANHLAPRIVSRIADGRWTAEQAFSWFALPCIRQALAVASQWTLFSSDGSARSWDRDCLPNLAKAIAAFTVANGVGSLGWVDNVLAKPLKDAYASGLSRAVDDLLTILSISPDVEGWHWLATHVLLAVRKNRGAATYQLVERIFPVLYPALVGGQLDSQCVSLLRSVVWRDWDIAKNWRHWLLDQWLDERWPPASFLRALGQDTALLRRIAYRAWHKKKAESFVKSLRHEVAEDCELAMQWREPVLRFLANPDAKLDYE